MSASGLLRNWRAATTSALSKQEGDPWLGTGRIGEKRGVAGQTTDVYE